MEFKVGDKVVLANGQKWDGAEYRTITEIITGMFGDYCRLSDILGAYLDDELELYKEQTEFTFQEVVARIKPGEVYEAINKLFATQTIAMREDTKIVINISDGQQKCVVPSFSLFKLQEPKKRVHIYKVEHQKDGSQYDFISSQLLDRDIFVVCDTCKGKSYGRVANIEYIELTETEISDYKECWRA